MCSASVQEALFQGFLYQSSRFFPIKIFEHHHCRKYNRTRVHHIFSRNIGSCSMSRFKDGMSCLIVDVCSRSNTDTAYHSCKLIGNIVSIQVQGSYYGIFFGNQECILQESIGNAIFYHQSAVCQSIGKFTLCQFVAPFLETTFCELHDISFMHQGYRR